MPFNFFNSSSDLKHISFLNQKKLIDKKATEEKIKEICSFLQLDVNERELNRIVNIWADGPITDYLPTEEFVIATKDFDQYVLQLIINLCYIITGGKHNEYSREEVYAWLEVKWKDDVYKDLKSMGGYPPDPRSEGKKIILGFSVCSILIS